MRYPMPNIQIISEINRYMYYFNNNSHDLNLNVAFIGSVGVPNIYGGFEMFLETCSPGFVDHFDKVFVTCDKNRYSDRTLIWRGVRRIFIPINANGVQSIAHDLVAFFAVFWRVDAIVVLGVSAGMFFPLFRVLCAFGGKKLIVNVDGIESRRKKFSALKQRFLYWSDRLTQRFAHKVVIDNEGLRTFLDPAVQASAVLIAYPGDHVERSIRRLSDAQCGPKILTICRIEPENQCHLLLEAFSRLVHGSYVFVGNWNASAYGRQLRQQYGEVQGLEMRDPVYDKLQLADLRENCDYYLHGHSVGGTNPSLVEMLFYDCEIFAFDCVFNRCTAGDAIKYFSDCDVLTRQLSTADHCINDSHRNALRLKYTRTSICNDYTSLINLLLK